MSVATFFDRASAGLGDQMAQALPDDVIVAFEIEGAGEWYLAQRDGRVVVGREVPDHVDCRLTCSAADFLALVRGDLRGFSEFRSGRLRVEGDVGLVLALQGVLSRSVA